MAFIYHTRKYTCLCYIYMRYCDGLKNEERSRAMLSQTATRKGISSRL